MLALVIGSASDFEYEVSQVLGSWQIDLVLATNRVVADCPVLIDAAVTLHPRLMVGWLEERAGKRYSNISSCVSHRNRQGGKSFSFVSHVIPYLWPEQKVSGSSGHFAVKAALDIFGADKVILAGVPMTEGRCHYYSIDEWVDAGVFRPAWTNTYDRLCGRVKSMSGWTSTLLGKPTNEWVEGRS